MKISGVVITYNEEDNILRCINSLKQVADEIIVVDSFSTDATANICKEEGCIIVQRKFDGYGSQKNYGNSLAKYDYILSLDADEELSEGLIKDIIQIKYDPKYDAYKTNRRNNIAGKWTLNGGLYPDQKIRLWKVGHAQWNSYIVHEETVVEKGSSVDILKNDLLHYPYSTYSEFDKTYSRYNKLKAQMYYDRGKHISYIQYLLRRFFKFFRSFIIKSGYKDGKHGYKIACIFSSVEKSLYQELKILYKKD